MMPAKHILIADDYPDALDIWAIFLRSLGYRVSTADNGASAILLAERLLPDLVVVDLELTRVSGFGVASRLRANPATCGIPLIGASDYSHLRQIDRARELGFDRVVVKPCDPDVLVEEIERLLPSGHSLRFEPFHLRVEHRHNNGYRITQWWSK
jgi:CheY-like chemotaxis protein